MTGDDFAAQAWATAGYHFAEALVQPPTAPGATMHLAQYTMFHAARAVLFRVTGSIPKTYSGVVEQFGRIVRDRSEALRQAAISTGSAIAAWWWTTNQIKRLSMDDARDALNRARSFLNICAAEFGFPHGDAPRDV